MGIVVGVGTADDLEGRPSFADCELCVGKEDKAELGVVNHDAIGMHVGNFGVEEFNVGDDLFWKSNWNERMVA